MLDKRLLKFLGEDKKVLNKIIILNILGTIFNILITFILVLIIKNIINYNLSNILIFSILIIIFIILKAFLYKKEHLIKTDLGNIIVHKVRTLTFHKYIYSEDFNYSPAKFLNLSITGVEQLRSYYTLFIPSFFTSMISPLILFTIISFFNIYVALFYLLLVPLIPISIILVSKKAKKVFSKYWDIYLNLGDSFLDNVKGLNEIKLFNLEDKISEKLDEESTNFRKITMKVLVMQLYSLTIMDIVAFGGASIGVCLTLFFMTKGLNPYYSLFIILIGAEFFLPLRMLGSAFHVAQNGKSAGNKLLDIIDLKEKEYSKEIDSVNNIKFKNVTLKYENIILENINLELKNGIYSFSGKSGSGKSSLTKSIVRLNNNYSGEILINDTNINDIKRESLYKNICYLSNNSYIFNDTIRNNFLFMNDKLTDEDIYNLLKKVKLESFYLEKGLDYIINDNNSNISGGEKQRLNLALLLANKYNVYIFDEITSNIDLYSEQIILNLIKELSMNNIIILISHRIKNLSICDYIYYLEDKEIKECGSFGLLVELGGKFYENYNKQKELEDIYENV